jgi:hypothetical protein
MANAAILREAYDHAVQYPDAHNQRRWAGDAHNAGAAGEFEVRAGNGDRPPCGTTLCAGGWVAFLNAPEGARITYDFAGYDDDDYDAGTLRFADGTTESIDSFATRTAELTDHQATIVYFVTRDAAELNAAITVLEADADAGSATLREAVYAVRES